MTAPRMRAGDADRQSAAERLAQHYTDGRLTTEEYDHRVERAYAVTYTDELPALFADLPSSGRWGATGGAEAGEAHGFSGGPFSGGPFSGGRPGSRGPARGGQEADGPRYRGRFRRGPHPAAIVLIALAVFVTIGALTHGFFPFPLLVIAAVFLLCRGSGHRRHWGPPAHDRAA